MPSRPALALCLALAACATFPEVDAAERQLSDLPPPDLLPTDALAALIDAPQRAESAAAALSGRVARLKARAARLRAMPSA